MWPWFVVLWGRAVFSSDLRSEELFYVNNLSDSSEVNPYRGEEGGEVVQTAVEKAGQTEKLSTAVQTVEKLSRPSYDLEPFQSMSAEGQVRLLQFAGGTSCAHFRDEGYKKTCLASCHNIEGIVRGFFDVH